MGQELRGLRDCQFPAPERGAFTPTEASTGPRSERPSGGNYKPDFYLPDANVYIDIVELSDSGEAPGFAGNRWEGSPESVGWKRDVHAKHETVLIEAYTHERVSGALLPNLADNLRRHGVGPGARFRRANSSMSWTAIRTWTG